MNVRNHGVVCSILLSLVCPLEARSDTIRMLDGTLHTGIIRSSDAHTVVMRTEGGDLTLLKTAMTLITFTSADRVVTTGADTIECKIVSRQDTITMAVTVPGPVSINESTIREIRFNAGAIDTTPLLASVFTVFRSRNLHPRILTYNSREPRFRQQTGSFTISSSASFSAVRLRLDSAMNHFTPDRYGPSPVTSARPAMVLFSERSKWAGT